jgi:hypothetical protein
MEKKRLLGVTIFSWLIIILSALNLISRLDYIIKSAQKTAKVGISDYFYLAVSIVSIVSGIYLLKLKNWARLVTLFISTLVFFDVLLKGILLLRGLSFGHMQIIILFMIIVPLVFEGAVIFYLTRAQVRDTFSLADPLK